MFGQVASEARCVEHVLLGSHEGLSCAHHQSHAQHDRNSEPQSIFLGNYLTSGTDPLLQKLPSGESVNSSHQFSQSEKRLEQLQNCCSFSINNDHYWSDNAKWHHHLWTTPNVKSAIDQQFRDAETNAEEATLTQTSIHTNWQLPWQWEKKTCLCP